MGIYLIRVCGLSTPSSPIPRVGLGGLVPRTESAVLGGLPFTSADYCDSRTECAVLGGLPFTSADFSDFRTHAPLIRIDGLSVPSERFVARVSASVATVDRCPGRGWALPAADNTFASVFALSLIHI